MKIRIIKGLYGLHTGKHRVEVIHSGEECQVPDQEAKRLESLGVARIVESIPPQENSVPLQKDPDLENMTKADLMAYAECLGVDVSFCKTKLEIRELLEMHSDESHGPQTEVPQL